MLQAKMSVGTTLVGQPLYSI